MTSWVKHLYGVPIRDFAIRHAHTRPPVSRVVTPPAVHGDRATASYGAHPYWSKKPHELVMALLQIFTRPGDLVLDPFAGSGGVPVLASRMGRPALGLDRSPAAAFITDTLGRIGTDPDVAAQMQSVTQRAGIASFYRTVCHRCGGIAEMQFAVWRDLLRCGSCGHVHVRPSGRRPACPSCGCRPNKAALRLGEQLEEIDAICRNGCKPARFRRRFSDDDSAARLAWCDRDVPAALRVRSWGVAAPRNLFPGGLKTAELFVRGITRVDQMFTRRNFVAMARVRAAIDETPPPGRHAVRLAWHAALMATSLKSQHLRGGGGYLPGMYYVPPLRKERNVELTLRRLARRLERAVGGWSGDGMPAPLLAGVGDARDLSDIPDACVDYIFLDPPYGEKIQYAELNFLWEAWLGADDDWRAADLVINRARGQSATTWLAGIGRVVAECARVLKPRAWLSLTYVPDRHTSAEHLRHIFAEAGFTCRDDMNGVVRNRQHTYVQRISSAAVADQVSHFQLHG